MSSFFDKCFQNIKHGFIIQGLSPWNCLIAMIEKLRNLLITKENEQNVDRPVQIIDLSISLFKDYKTSRLSLLQRFLETSGYLLNK